MFDFLSGSVRMDGETIPGPSRAVQVGAMAGPLKAFVPVMLLHHRGCALRNGSTQPGLTHSLSHTLLLF